MLMTPRRRLAILITGLLLLSACNAPRPAATQVPSIPLQDCQLAAPGISTRLAAKCGSLKVYEDPSTETGRQISLNIAVIPAISRNDQPDPLFFLSGGPGQSATETYLQLSRAFDRIHQKRDIVLLDQRGTGKSNPLECPNLEEADIDNLPANADPAPYLKECLQKLDANPALYTTSIAMGDLDRVRAGLGYDRMNLYGVSYGTRAALTYMKQFPEHVRAVILDGVVPQDEILGLYVAQDAQRSLNLIFDRCESNPDCHQAFPDLKSDFAILLQSLSEVPVKVTLEHPVTGERTELNFTSEKFASAVRLLSYAPETAALLPLLIHTASTEKDFSLFAAQYLIVSNQLIDSISEGMNYSVQCAEDVPFYSAEKARQAAKGTYLEAVNSDMIFKICQTWPKGTIPAGFKEPVSSASPVLILSGEADPVTPPENGEEVAKTLPNSLALVVPGQGHNVIFRGCLPRVASDFIEQGSVQGLNTACVSEIRPLPFFVNFSGPKP